MRRSASFVFTLRGYVALCLAGFLVALLLTFGMRSVGSADMGFLLFCTVETVPEPEFPGVLTTFAFEPIWMFLIGAAAVGYLFMARNLRMRGKARLVTKGRTISFLVGLLLVLVVVFGPLAAYSRTFLSAHMIQHFLLITIAPPLLLAGAPLTILLAAAGKKRRDQWLYPVLHSRPFHAFTHPVVGVVLFAIIPIGWFITPAFETSLTNSWVHHLGYAIFLFAGVHYWWPVVGGNPTRWNLPHAVRLLYLFALVPIHAFLGSYFYEPEQVMFEELHQIPRAWGPSPLMDQKFAGMMMFVLGELIGLIAVIIAAMRWAQADEREARRYDAARARRRAMAARSNQ